MKTVPKRELNQHTADVLAGGADAGAVIVTERGEPRLRLTSYSPSHNPLDWFERAGLFTPPLENPARWPAEPGGRRYTDAEVEALLSDVKGDS